VILISAWSRLTTDNLSSPKNYPHWDKVIAGLRAAGHEVHQLACSGEQGLGVKRSDNLTFPVLTTLLRECDTWISVDNFFPHMAWTLKEPGVVIFGLSDPLIFGHTENINLLKDRRYLRDKQFWLWSQCKADPSAFVGPEIVVAAAMSSIAARKRVS
jgi:ADP-heptose:LPS heptosyltransferase